MGLSTPILLAEKSANGYSNALGQAAILSYIAPMSNFATYPFCSGKYKALCVKCKAEARSKPRNAWLKDGKENYIACFKRELEKLEAVGETGTYSDQQVEDILNPKPEVQDVLYSQQTPTSKMSQETKNYLLIGGGVLAIGLLAVIILKR